MQLYRLSPGTPQLYAKAITDLVRYYRRSPDQRTPDDIRAYLYPLLQARMLAWRTCNVMAAAIRFFDVETLDWPPLELNLPPRPDYERLPRVPGFMRDTCSRSKSPEHVSRTYVLLPCRSMSSHEL